MFRVFALQGGRAVDGAMRCTEFLQLAAPRGSLDTGAVEFCAALYQLVHNPAQGYRAVDGATRCTGVLQPDARLEEFYTQNMTCVDELRRAAERWMARRGAPSSCSPMRAAGRGDRTWCCPAPRSRPRLSRSAAAI